VVSESVRVLVFRFRRPIEMVNLIGTTSVHLLATLRIEKAHFKKDFPVPQFHPSFRDTCFDRPPPPLVYFDAPLNVFLTNFYTSFFV
jgi:hypothetical protein